MFTGIVQGMATLVNSIHRKGLATYTLKFPEDKSSTQVGASVALNGTCLTVVKVDQDQLVFDLMAETLKLTNLGELNESRFVNFEHAARIGDEIGGHLMSGHIHCTARLILLNASENNLALEFEIPERWSKYVFDKGFIGVNGASLTVSAVEANRFTVNLIPETLRVANFRQLSVGDMVNIEIDSQTQTTVDTIERVLPAMLQK